MDSIRYFFSGEIACTNFTPEEAVMSVNRNAGAASDLLLADSPQSAEERMKIEVTSETVKRDGSPNGRDMKMVFVMLQVGVVNAGRPEIRMERDFASIH
jgi:hypothetical protein